MGNLLGLLLLVQVLAGCMVAVLLVRVLLVRVPLALCLDKVLVLVVRLPVVGVVMVDPLPVVVMGVVNRVRVAIVRVPAACRHQGGRLSSVHTQQVRPQGMAGDAMLQCCLLAG